MTVTPEEFADSVTELLDNREMAPETSAAMPRLECGTNLVGIKWRQFCHRV